jgi:hypothetical protein
VWVKRSDGLQVATTPFPPLPLHLCWGKEETKATTTHTNANTSSSNNVNANNHNHNHNATLKLKERLLIYTKNCAHLMLNWRK